MGLQKLYLQNLKSRKALGKFLYLRSVGQVSNKRKTQSRYYLMVANAKFQVKPVTAARWKDLVELFGPSGAYSGCWCMFPRLSGAEFSANGNGGNKAAMQKIVARNEIPGLLAYAAGKAVGWISVGPRPVFGRIERSPLFKRLDEKPVWSVVCFFIHHDFRNQGVGRSLLKAAADYARKQGARTLEAYPVDTQGKPADPPAIFYGTQSLFEEAGFKVVARRKERRPMMQKQL
jgi:GNAT superfamily N-acetyltransferase